MSRYATTDVFDEYAKIAIEQGLISSSDEEQMSKTAEEKTNPRYDTKSMSDIEILYHIKPNGKDDDVLDKAHPKSVIIAPAYDRVNGLVENLKEQHDIMCGIALKPNNGLLTQHRYVEAHRDLLNEVIKVAFMLDKNDENELMVLADSCAERLVKKADTDLGAGAAGVAGAAVAGVGVAATIGAGVGLAGTAGIAALVFGAVVGVGALAHWLNQPKARGLKKEIDGTLGEIVDLKPEEKEHLAPFINKLNSLKDASDSFFNVNGQLTKIFLTISVASNEDEKKLAIANNAAQFINSGQDKAAIEINKKVGELAGSIANSAPIVLSILKKWDDDSQSDSWAVTKLYRENIVDTQYVDVINELKILAGTCSTISATTGELNQKLANLRDVVKSAGAMPSKSPTETPKSESDKKPEEKPGEKPEEKPKSKLPPWA
jgi:hypothetical protein